MDCELGKRTKSLRNELLSPATASLMKEIAVAQSTLRTAEESGALSILNDPIWRAFQSSIHGNLPAITAAELGLNTSIVESVIQAQQMRTSLMSNGAVSGSLTLSGLLSRPAFAFVSESLKSNLGLALDAVFSTTPTALGAGFAAVGLGDAVFDSVRSLALGDHQNIAMSDFALGAATLTTMRDLEKITGISSDLLAQQRLLATAFSGFTHQLTTSTFPPAFVAAGLSTASALVEQAAASFAEVIRLPEEGDRLDQAVEPNVFASLYASIQTEAVSAEPDIERLAGAIPAHLARLALEIVLLWDEIAMLSETNTGESIFKPTRRSMMVSGRLGLVVVSSREEFERLAEDLYFYLYEASANWTRVTVHVPDFPKVVERIKHVRLYKSHDTQHGKEREIENKARQVGDHLQELTGKRLPETPGDWQRAQIGLLSEVADFLRHLRDAMFQGTPQT